MAYNISRPAQLDPRILLVDVVVRYNVQLDRQFVDSVRERGVLVPIVAIDTPYGLRVRHGHRRTLAAIEAGLDTVPVMIVDPQSSDPVAEASKIERELTRSLKTTAQV